MNQFNYIMNFYSQTIHRYFSKIKINVCCGLVSLFNKCYINNIQGTTLQKAGLKMFTLINQVSISAWSNKTTMLASEPKSINAMNRLGIVPNFDMSKEKFFIYVGF